MQSRKAFHCEAAYNLGFLWDDDQEYDMAAERYQRAIELADLATNPEPPFAALDALNNLGCLRDLHGRAEEAEAIFRQAAVAGHGAATNNLAMVYEERGDLAEAQARQLVEVRAESQRCCVVCWTCPDLRHPRTCTSRPLSSVRRPGH